ncbi:hypothetical protein NM208_g5481 [Fusarium decemcellulare]|uniref:Uncharacterized protein n=1 Tax=Fusarium decemcellulare TaxID=57161 RepID=A0ACC1SH64_9HYPO|nr:hypothetical protein NM208_g5481 [Fusarium decemcellulare]
MANDKSARDQVSAECDGSEKTTESVLLAYLHDTSSLQDRLIQRAAADSTSAATPAQTGYEAAHVALNIDSKASKIQKL